MPGYREVVRCSQCGSGHATRRRLRDAAALAAAPSARVRTVHLVRPGQPLRVHADDPGANLSEERAKRLHAVHARERRSSAKRPRREPTMPARRSTTCSSSRDASSRNGDRETVRRHLGGLTHPVRLLFFTQTFDEPETASVARQILDEVVSLSDQVTIEEVNFVLDKDRARPSESRAFRRLPCCEGTWTRGCAFSARRPATSSCR